MASKERSFLLPKGYFSRVFWAGVFVRTGWGTRGVCLVQWCGPTFSVALDYPNNGFITTCRFSYFYPWFISDGKHMNNKIKYEREFYPKVSCFFNGPSRCAESCEVTNLEANCHMSSSMTSPTPIHPIVITNGKKNVILATRAREMWYSPRPCPSMPMHFTVICYEI